MATNEREVSLRISAKADGNDQIRALAAEIDKLAKEGGDAAPAFAELGKQLSSIANQQGLIQQFSELKKKTVEAEQAFNAATSATAAAASALREKKAALESANAAEQAANNTLTQSKQKLEANKAALASASAELKGYREAAKASGGATTEQAAAIAATEAKVKSYRDAIKAAREEVKTLSPAQKEAAASAKQAEGALNGAAKAFDESKRAAQGAKSEYERSGVALQGLRNSLQQAGVSTNSLADAQRKATAESGRLATEANRLKDAQRQAGEAAKLAGQQAQEAASKTAASAGNTTSAIRGMAAPLAAAFAVDKFIETNIALENTGRALLAITGTASGAASEMAFLKDTSNRLGIDLLSATKAYTSLLAATKGTAVEGAKTREVFVAVSQAMNLAGKSSADTEGALQALSQMASKGVISMEEMRQQLGERLPGAMQAAANGFGITTAQLNKLIASGTLTAEDLFPAMTRGLNELYKSQDESGKSTETLSQKWAKFQNTITQVFQSIGDAGVIDTLKIAIVGLGAALATTNIFFTTLGKTIGTFFGALLNGDVTFRGFSDTAKEAFAEIEKEASDKLVKAAMSNEYLAASLTGTEKAAYDAAKASAALAAEQDKATAAAQAGSPTWIATNLQYIEMADSAKLASEQATKNAVARAAEAEAAVTAANAFGTEKEQRDALGASSKANAEALQAVADARKNELTTAQSHLLALESEISASGRETEAQKKVKEELQKKVEARQADSDKATAQAEASKVVSAQSAVEALTHADNSSRLFELKAAYEAATAAKLAGATASKTQADLDREAAIAARLYRDAISDQQAAIQSNLNVRKGKIDLAEASIRLSIEELRSLQQLAAAQGDEARAGEYGIQIKRLEIELAGLKAIALRAEAEAQLASVAAKREDLIATGQLNAEKERELKATELAAQVKMKEAEIAGVLADRLKNLSVTSGTATSSTYALGDAAVSSARGFDQLGGSAETASEKIRKATDALHQQSLARAGFGTTRDGGETNWASVLAQRGIDLSKEQMDAFSSVIGLETSKAQGRRVGRQWTPSTYNEIVNEAVRAALSYASEKSPDAIATRGGAGMPLLDAYRGAEVLTNRAGGEQDWSSVAGNLNASKTVTVNVNFGGASRQITAASQADAQNLIDLLKQFESRAQ